MQNTESPLVSIIIPCYKAEKELPQALESISNQTYKNWELIAVNDCWNDGTESQIQEFKNRNPKNTVKYLKHSINQGPAASRNTGFQSSNGQFIAFLDHDDIWEPNHISIGTEALQNEAADIHFCSVIMFDSNNKSTSCIWGATDDDMADFPNALFNRNFIPPSAAILTRAITNRIGQMDIKSIGCEDHDYWLRAVKLGARFLKSETITVRYRYSNPYSLSSNNERLYWHDIIIQKKHYKTRPFSKKSQRTAISGNYKRLSLARWKHKPLSSILSLILALYWNPKDWSVTRRLIKGILLLPFFFTQKTVINLLTPHLKMQKSSPLKNIGQ